MWIGIRELYKNNVFVGWQLIRSEVTDWLFTKGVEVSEASYRLAVVSELAESKGCPIIDMYRELIKEG